MKIRIIAALLSLVCLTLSSCTVKYDSDDSNTVSKLPVSSTEIKKDSTKESSPEKTPAEDTVALLGETLDYNGLKLTLDSVENYVDKTEYPIDKADEGNVFVVLTITAQNDTENDEHINMFYEDSYCDDTSIDPEVMMINVKGDTLWGDVAVGKKRKGYICYEVPKDWSTLEFYYSPEIFESKTKMKFKVLATDIKAQ